VARILVTGAGGFIGRAVCPALAAHGHQVIAGLRRAGPDAAPVMRGIEPRGIGDIDLGGDWAAALRGVDIVVHLAQRAHRTRDRRAFAAEPTAAAALARGGGRAGVRRFIYISSIRAMGEVTEPGRPFRPDDPPRPEGAYGSGKLASEEALAEAAAETGIDLVVIRPPLVYGPDAHGNFRALARLAASGLPLPFAGLANRRSMIFVENLADLIATAATHPAATGQALLAADGAALPVAELIRLLATVRGRRARLFAVPAAVFGALRLLPGIGPAVAPLTLSLEVDDAESRTRLGWAPPHPADAALQSTALAVAGP
jgi:nucleoside-diphosphate-sugar epimerase